MSTSTERSRSRRAALRAKGLRPIELWVLDTRRPEVVDEIHRQCRLLAASDQADPELQDDIDRLSAISD